MGEQSIEVREQLLAEQIIIPEEATHLDILRDTIASLQDKKAVLITGESRAGKTTFLKNSLESTLATNRHELSFQNCIAEDPEIVTKVLTTYDGVIILDEAFRLSYDQGYVDALKNRIASHRPVVICNTRSQENPQIDEAIQQFVKAIGADNELVTKIDFPLEVNDDDAKKVIKMRLALINEKFRNHGKSINADLDKFSDKLIELTRNPKILADVVDYAVRSGALEDSNLDVYEFISASLNQDKTYFERSLKEEKEKIKAKLQEVQKKTSPRAEIL